MLAPGGEIQGRTEFQRKRLVEAVTAARLYLEGEADTQVIARTLDRTPERAAQVVRLGISWMRREGWLRPGEQEPSPKPSPSRS